MGIWELPFRQPVVSWWNVHKRMCSQQNYIRFFCQSHTKRRSHKLLKEPQKLTEGNKEKIVWPHWKIKFTVQWMDEYSKHADSHQHENGNSAEVLICSCCPCQHHEDVWQWREGSTIAGLDGCEERRLFCSCSESSQDPSVYVNNGNNNNNITTTTIMYTV